MHWILKCSRKLQIGWWHTATFRLSLILASVCDYRHQTPETLWFLSFLLPLWYYLTHFMTLPAIVLRWIKIICCFVARGCFQWRGLGYTGFRGVRQAPQTQEGSTLSHSQGCQGWTLVFLLRPSPLTLSIINISITIDLSNLMGGMSGQKHVSSMLFNWHEFSGYKCTGL